MISYEEACEIVYSAKKFGICLGLERMELMLKELGNPEKKIPVIHLAGTNGKGSTLTYLSSIYRESGYDVGTYTSPAINKINDKVRFNGEEITDQDFAYIVEQFIPIIEKLSLTSFGPPTEFELMTALAFQYFATIKKPDMVLVETGLGGRLDSTNVVTPILSIITNIGHDHMEILGDTISKVATEKAGIIKEGVPVVSGCKQEDAIAVMKERSIQLASPLYQLGVDFTCDHFGNMFSFHSKNNQYLHLQTGMLGKHQQENASLAIMALHCLNQFPFSETAIRAGLLKAKIANRIEIVQQNPIIILDGGHNPEGIEALATTLAARFSDKKIYVLFCAMKDKDIKEMLRPLGDLATEIILTSFLYDRVMDPYQVLEAYPLTNSKVIENWTNGYEFIKNKLNTDDVFVITGSLYFLNHIRATLKNKF